MRLYAILAAVVLQVGVLAWMGGQREWIYRHGQIVYLRTAPLDPRDPFRGDYVRLNYEISLLKSSELRDGLKAGAKGRKRDAVVYTKLKVRQSGLATAEYASDQRPAEGPFIRGRVNYNWWGGDRLGVRYGIEAYFMQQGEAEKLERGRRLDNNIQLPLQMEVALSKGGTAVLRGYRWSDLGIGVRVSSRTLTTTTRSMSATMTLYNASDHPLAIVVLPDQREWRLANTEWGMNTGWSAPVDDTPMPAPTAESVKVLAPGESHTMVLDLDAERWRVIHSQEPDTVYQLGTVNQWQQWRLVYAPPSPEACRGLPHEELIWHGELPSAAFSAVGRID